MKTPWWFLHKTPLAFLMVPLSWVYYFISRLVYLFRKIGAYKSGRVVICVGNIMAGGVGKTPIVRQIAKKLDAPVVMRGYKKSAKTGNVGDEASMLARDGIQVHTGDRKSNVILLDRQAHERGPIVMDDGFQNPRVKKNISVLVFSQKLGVGNGFLLPAGPLREPRRAVRRADAVIIIRDAGGKKVKKIKLPASVPVFYATNKTVSPYSDGTALYAFAGIGYPKKFFASLKNVVGRKSFADHYQYTDDDLKKLAAVAKRKKASLITTEKDWVRLPDEYREKIKYARLETIIDDDFWKWLGDKINANN